MDRVDMLDSASSPLPHSIPPALQRADEPSGIGVACDGSTAHPLSIASFSFSQFLSCHDTTTVEANADRILSVPEASAAGSAPPSLSVKDCVLLKLSLTCALCGRLLRRRPAAIETCGHCFCYSCVNTAVEDGCVPLTTTWPWSRLAAEADAAMARWTAAQQAAAAEAATSETHAAREAAPQQRGSDSPAPLPDEATGGEASTPMQADDADDVVVTAVTPRRAASAAPMQRGGRRRKVHQKCPLCLGPAFKWLLVPVPTLGELCGQLHNAYPALETMLEHLTEDTAGAEEGACTPEAKETRTEQAAQGQQSSPAQGGDFVAAAFTQSPAQPHTQLSRDSSSSADASQPNTASSDEEEAERRRRRSSGGPRKEITFADAIATCVAEARPPPSPPLEHQHAETVAEEQTSAGDGDEAAVHEAPGSADDVAGHSPGNVAPALALQLSLDLIPSPSFGFHVPRTEAMGGATWSDEAIGANPTAPLLNAEPLIPGGVLGQSPLLDAHVVETERGELPVAAVPSSQLPYLAETAEGSADDEAEDTPAVSAPAVRAPVGVGRAVREWEVLSSGTVLLDTNVAPPPLPPRHAHGPLAFLSDTAPGDAPSPESAYSSVRGWSSGDGAAGWTDPAIAASVHPSDVWVLDTAFVRRHAAFPSCYVVLRRGRLVWGDSRLAASSTLRQDGSLACVAGVFPPSRSSSAETNGSEGGRFVSVLTPAVCTAVALGVPCVDVACFSHPNGILPERRRVAGEFCATFTPQSRVAPIVSRCTQRLLAVMPQSATDPSPGGGASFFFVLPDGALAEMAATAHTQWSTARHSVMAPPLITSARKRRRDEGAVDGAWWCTDGHPQRAWRRLLLAAGGACVEVSAALLRALAETAGERADDVPTSPLTREEAVLAAWGERHRSSGHTAAQQWIHVDVADDSMQARDSAGEDRRPAQAPTTVSVEDVSCPASALYVLYSTERVRAWYPAEGEEFHALLQSRLSDLAALVTAMLSPVLDGTAAAGQRISHKVVAAQWVMENLVGCPCCPDSDTAESLPSPRDHSAQQDRLPHSSSVVSTTGGAVDSCDESHMSLAGLLTHPLTPPVSPLAEGSQVPPLPDPRRVGVYRSLLYSDTP